MIHCDVDFLAGHNRDARGNAGRCSPVFASTSIASFFALVVAEAELAAFLNLDLWGELVDGISAAAANATPSEHLAPRGLSRVRYGVMSRDILR